VITGIWESVTASIVAAIVAYWRNFLTLPAALAAALIGSVILVLGGWNWGAATAGAFFATSVLSRHRDRIEQNNSIYANSRRKFPQVFANGIALALLAVLHGTGVEQYGGVDAAFLGCVGAVAGDTWATAVARYSSKEPRLVTSGRRVPAGTPGAVSFIGIVLTGAAGVFASLLYFSASMIVYGETVPRAHIVTLTCAAIIGGVTGSLLDSYLGAACQAKYLEPNGRLTDHPFANNGRPNKYVGGWRWLSNDLVNFSNSVTGAASAYIVWLVSSLLKIV
jgi:uncharacterized protein (TIGR00297 family)